jgi:hypothetical protein
MSRRDSLVLGFWCAAVLALLAPVWARPGAVFFNHGDLYAYHVPLRSLTAVALQRGHLPFWNPFILLGVPHAANSQAALFYPPALLTVFFPVARALTWDQIFHLLWAGVGLFLLARSHRLDRAAAAVLASSFALSPFLVYRVTQGIPTLLAALAWAPWVWLAWLDGRRELLAAALALQLFSGHGQFLVVNAAGMAVWALCRARRRELLRRLAVEGAAAAALSCAQWPLTAQFLRRSVRADWSGAASGLYALTPASLLTWLHPGALGTPLDGRWPGAISEFYETAAGNVGLVLLAAAAVGLARGRRRLGAAVLGVLGVVLAFGPRNAVLRGVLSMPGLGYLRTPGRWLFLSVWSAVLLGGAGLASLRDGAAARGTRAFAALAAFVLLAAWDAKFLSPQDPATFLASRPEIVDNLAGRPFRVLTDPVFANPNKSVLYRMRNVNGYEAFYLRGVPAWADAAQGAVASDASRVYISRWPSSVLAQAGVVARMAPDGLAWQKAWPLAFFIDAAGRRLDAPLKIFSAEAERWRLKAVAPPAAAGIVLLEPSYPGWRAWLDGRKAEIFPWGVIFQAVALAPVRTPGVPTTLTFDFTPTGWAGLSVIMAAAWAAWFALALRRAQSL